ncbi:hypothetical protein RD792_012678 [Penstemon davidsonii]|uniref:Protein kinase domain-containing protein n=1 Tax=Penstemon davidsonii TaxID=160366 RepID=A0ABR0CXK8_9LAMI|nr:hypothetical protein RD792_012678 [Penstemon davidsonii]
MGLCHGKPIEPPQNYSENPIIPYENNEPVLNSSTGKTPKFPFYSPSPLSSAFKNSPAHSSSSVSSTPLRFFKKPFPPPSPAKHIKALLARRHGSVKPNTATIPEGSECGEIIGLDKNFGFSKNFISHYEISEEVGRGHFGYTCSGKGKKGSLKGLDVAVKVIPKSKMTTVIAIEDVRREVRMLRALTGHKNLVQFYEAYEDEDNVYVVMELCNGGELLDRILSRGGKYPEEDAKVVMVQILSVVAYCHLQGVVHRDLKPEMVDWIIAHIGDMLALVRPRLYRVLEFHSKDEHSPLKAIDFGLSDYVKPDERLNDIVGSAYYVAPEVLHRSYGTEADMWSIGVIAYILLCGSRPFWSRTESGIFRAVLKADPSFDEAPWPSLSPDAVDFVKRLLNKDYRKRLTAAQALSHPWLVGHHDVKIPLDMITYKLVKAYICSSSLRKAALGALAKTLTIPQLAYLRDQFTLLGPNKSGFISLQNFKLALSKNSTDAMKDSRVLDYVDVELGLGPSVPVHVVLQDWLRHSDGKLSFLGFVRLLHGVSSRAFQKV